MIIKKDADDRRDEKSRGEDKTTHRSWDKRQAVRQGLKRMNTYTWSRLQSHTVARPHELTRMSALNCILLNSLVAIKFASSLTVFSSRVLIERHETISIIVLIISMRGGER